MSTLLPKIVQRGSMVKLVLLNVVATNLVKCDYLNLNSPK